MDAVKMGAAAMAVVCAAGSAWQRTTLLVYLAELAQFLSGLRALFLHHRCMHQITARSSSDLFLVYWPISIMLALLTLRSRLRLSSGESDLATVAWSAVYTISAAIVLYLEAYNESCVEANLYSRLLFSWVTPVIDEACRSDRNNMPTFDIPRRLSGDTVWLQFLDRWDIERRSGRGSLIHVLLRGIWYETLVSGLFLLASTCSQLVQPLLLRQIIMYFHDFASPNRTVSVDDGIVLAMAMGLVGASRAVLYQAYWHKLMQPYLWLLRCLSALVYHKSLVLSSEMRAKYSPGEISTYLSVDTERLATAINYIHCTWDYPLRIVVVLCALYRLLGYSALAGVAVLVASTQLSALLVQVVDRKFKQLVDYRDQRLRMVGETIGNIKQVKMYSWQDAFADRIDSIRTLLELPALRSVGLWKGVMSLASSLVSFFIGFVTFAAYESLNGEPRRPLTSQLVFVSLSLFAILQEPIAEIPTAVSMLLNAARSLVRLCDFAMCDEVVPDIRQCQNSNRGDATDMMIQIVDGAFRWSVNDSASVLSGVNVECQRGELVSVIGKVGSGKSSLISAILGDMVRTTGEVHIYGTVAYVPQQPWIFNATLRDNILFGRHFDKELYDQVIDACALGPDLSMFAAGDLTEIGEKGVNLSGGQKARVSLARAVYSRADIYILDDPLSAVDVHVGRHIFKHVLGPQGMLNSYACILTTNNVDYVLAGSDRIVSIDGGRVRYQDLGFGSVSPHHATERVQDKTECPSSPTNTRSRIIQSEDCNLGRVSLATVRYYLSSCGVANVCILGTTALLAVMLAVCGNLWLAHWAEQNDKNNIDDSTASVYYLVVYGALTAGSAGTMAASLLVLWLRCSYSASQHTHQKLVRGIVQSPVSFFDTTPVGRILGLFGSDQTLVDDGVPAAAEAGLKALSQALVSLVLIAMSMPAMLAVFIPLGFVYASLQSRFIPIARHARGSVNAARNIGISAIDEALNGSATIRAYKRRDSFEGAFSACTENYARAWWTFLCPNRWLATRLDLVSAAIACTAALLLVTMQCLFNSISSSYAGLSLTYALAIVGVLNTCLRSTMMIELSFISVERIRQYSLVTPEAESAVDGCRPAEMWPEHGSLEFAGYSARYRRDADLVLKDLSFRVEPRHKVGIVGRTGAGKSSLTLALFRIIEAASGKILIDGMDIAQYGLCDVRSRLSIIPQDPLMFAATVRQNLDPLGDYSDQQIWSALERVHLAESVRSKGEGLEYGVAQGGANFSVGQRQLFCIARALLKRARILVLDEATAAIDSSTDAMIQETIRREFRECTVLTIAHRLDTIIDSDMVLVIDSGSVAEYDTPDNLLAHKASVFSLLVAEARAGATAEQSSPQRHQK